MPTTVSYTISSPAVAPPPGETALGFSALAYARQLKRLLPPGRLFALLTDSWLSKALHAIATELARIDARGLDLLEESDPRTTSELLEDWERVLALPEPGEQLGATEAERQAEISWKVVARGGQSIAFYVAVAAAMGITATVTEWWTRVLRAGFRAGDLCWGIDQAHTWQMNVSNATAAGLYLPPPTIGVAVWLDTLGGSLVAGTYSYKVTAINAAGETLASIAAEVVVGAGTATNRTQVNWTAVAGATGYKVYGRTGGAELLMATVGAVVLWIDDGSVAPAGALPAVNTALNAKSEVFEATIQKARPAHSVVLFEYSG